MASGKKTQTSNEFPEDANGRVLQGILAGGADMSLEYDVDFEHVFVDLASAEQFAAAAKKLKHRIELSEYDGTRSWYWQVRVVVRLIPTHSAITDTEESLGDLARSHSGEPDGWGMMVP